VVVGVLTLDLYLPGNQSLKGKRQVLRGLVERLSREFRISVSEVGDGDRWQRTRVGIALVARSRGGAVKRFQEVREWLEKNRQVEMIDYEEEIIAFS